MCAKATDATLAIQAGGKSARMGREKALLPFMGMPLIQWIAQRGQAFSDHILVTTQETEKYQFLGLPLFGDQIANCGPLGGFHAALGASEAPYVAMIGCDMPFFSPQMLTFLLRTLQDKHLDAAVPRTAHGLEPLHAVYRREVCLHAVQSAVDEGQYALTGWLGRVKTITPDAAAWAAFDPEGLAFMNVNTPEDYQQAQSTALRLFVG